MPIKKYGLDAAEIEALEAQGKTDEEINAANAQRVREQIDAEEPDNSPNTAEEERVCNLLPGVHPSVAGYILTAPSWVGRKDDDGYIKQAFEKIRRRGLESFNAGLKEAFAACEGADELPVDFYDFSREREDELLTKQEELLAESTPESEKELSEVSKDADALSFASELISSAIDA